MSSMDTTALTALIDRSAYPVLLDNYNGVENVRQQLFETVPTDGSLYGDKGRALVGLGEPDLIEDGQEIKADAMGAGYTWYARINRMARRCDIPARFMEAVDAEAKIGNLMAEKGKEWGVTFASKKEQMAADFLQKGTLTAGDASVFNGTDEQFLNTDPYPKFIYDGGPFFDTAHAPANGAGNAYSNITVSAALSQATLQAGLTLMKVTNAENERGVKININPDVLVVPAGALEYTAGELLKSPLKPAGATNDVNVIQGIVRPVAWRYLTDDADAWWLGQSGVGLRQYDSGAPVLSMHFDPLKQVHYFIAQSFWGGVVTNARYWASFNKAAS